MVFPHGQPSRKKKYKIGYLDKKGNSYADKQTAVASAGKDVGATANTTDSANPVLQPLLRYHGPTRIGQITIKFRGH